MSAIRVCTTFVNPSKYASTFSFPEIAPSKVILRRLEAHLKFSRTKARIQRLTTATTTTTSSPGHHIEQHVSTTFVQPSTKPPQRSNSPTAFTVPVKPQLPQSCPGCGALTQESEPGSAGHYSRDRRVVKKYLQKQKTTAAKDVERNARAVGQAEMEADVEAEEEEDDDDGEMHDSDKPEKPEKITKTPFCDRCHNLLHNSQGHPIAHPTIEDIADSIAESPFKRNHIYHVVDAADFPMSLVPNLFSKLTLAKPRSQNRRSQHDFSTKPTLSFIITRSDLLGSTKEMVDTMMTYFKSVLRQSLGNVGKDIRLGNVHLVSAKRGWWTKEIKEEIWKRGGGNWMVGKVNVGKSNLFEVLFPKGSGDRAPAYAELYKQQQEEGTKTWQDDLMEEGKLLPPAQPEAAFPVLPIVSSLPGTTASPIRLPFGRHKGELIDLPGLERGDIENFVQPEHRLDLVMTHRHNVEQHIIKAGQSLLLGGGLIRITPQLDPEDPSITMLAYPFVPLKAHVTSTDKASSQQLQQRQSGIESIVIDEAGGHMVSAGLFRLSTDVTKMRVAPLLRSGVAIDKLPFRVFATDVLVEGIGWIELVCQVRRQPNAYESPPAVAPTPEATSHINAGSNAESSMSQRGFAPFANRPAQHSGPGFHYPIVEIVSPNGKHISQRACLSAWTRWEDGGRHKEYRKSRKSR